MTQRLVRFLNGDMLCINVENVFNFEKNIAQIITDAAHEVGITLRPHRLVIAKNEEDDTYCVMQREVDVTGIVENYGDIVHIKLNGLMQDEESKSGNESGKEKETDFLDFTNQNENVVNKVEVWIDANPTDWYRLGRHVSANWSCEELVVHCTDTQYIFETIPRQTMLRDFLQGFALNCNTTQMLTIKTMSSMIETATIDSIVDSFPNLKEVTFGDNRTRNIRFTDEGWSERLANISTLVEIHLPVFAYEMPQMKLGRWRATCLKERDYINAERIREIRLVRWNPGDYGDCFESFESFESFDDL